MRDEELWKLGDDLRALAALVRRLERRLADLERHATDMSGYAPIDGASPHKSEGES